jgi:hypothetical protein
MDAPFARSPVVMLFLLLKTGAENFHVSDSAGGKVGTTDYADYTDRTDGFLLGMGNRPRGWY